MVLRMIREFNEDRSRLLKALTMMGYDGFEIDAVVRFMNAFKVEPKQVLQWISFGCAPDQLIGAYLLSVSVGQTLTGAWDDPKPEEVVARWFSTGAAEDKLHAMRRREKL